MTPTSRRLPSLSCAGACVCAAALFVVAVPSTTSAQTYPSAAFPPPPPVGTLPDDLPPPAHVGWIEGRVFLVREGALASLDQSAPVIAGDVIETQRGRINILLDDGSAIDLDEDTTFEMLGPAYGQLRQGRLMAHIAPRDRSLDATFTIDTPAATIDLSPGQFLVEAAPGRSSDAMVSTVRGRAWVENAWGTVEVRQGERASLDRVARTAPRMARFNTAGWDDFAAWSDALRRARASAVASAEYLPTSLRPYGGVLERDGIWRDEVGIGVVWYPRVAQTWRPYEQGHWVLLNDYGWTWAGGESWSWPTHHYGRWGYGARGWYWIPGTTWAPAWVHWSFESDHVAWWPMGRDDRPAIAVAGRTSWIVAPRDRFYSPRAGRVVLPDSRIPVPRTGRERVAPRRDEPARPRDNPSLRPSRRSPAAEAAPRRDRDTPEAVRGDNQRARQTPPSTPRLPSTQPSSSDSRGGERASTRTRQRQSDADARREPQAATEGAPSAERATQGRRERAAASAADDDGGQRGTQRAVARRRDSTSGDAGDQGVAEPRARRRAR